MAAGKAGALMAISLKAVGSYVDLATVSPTITIPGSPAAGDRMFLFASWKDYAEPVTGPAGWTDIGSAYADGTVSAGNGSGSMMVHAWYRDWQSGDANPTIGGTSGLEGGTAVIQLWEKDPADTWATPLTTNAAWASSTSQTVSAVSSVAVPDGSAVIALAGFADAVTTITRGTTDIDVSSGITWDGNYTESPSGHFSSSAELNSAVDIGYRMVTTGGTVTPRMTATLSSAETGAVKFIVQGLVGAGSGSTTDVHIIAGAECPSTIANVAAGAVAWTNVANADIEDATYATATLTSVSTQTDILKCTDFGFNIPTDATILGIEVYMLRSTDVAGTVLDYKVQLYKNGTLNGDDKATGTDWSTSDAWATYGADNDLWSTAITASEINQSNFGVGIQAQVGVDTVPCVANIDAVGITVYYHTDGLYGSDPAASYIEVLRPLAALNTDWAVSTVANIQDVVFAPQTVDGVKNYVEGLSEWNQQYSLDAPTIIGTISRATLWMLISVEASETTQLVGGRVRLNGTWYDHASVYNTISGPDQYWWSLQFNGLSEAAIGSSPAFEIINQGTSTGTFYLDAAYLEIELAEGPRGYGSVLGEDLFYGVGGRTFEGYGSVSGTGDFSGTGLQPAGGYGWLLGADAFSGVGRVPDSGYGPVTGTGYFYGVGRLPDSGYGSVSGAGVLSGTGSVPASSAVVRLRRAGIMGEW